MPLQEDYLIKRVYLVVISYAINLFLSLITVSFNIKLVFYIFLATIIIKFLFLLSIYINHFVSFMTIKVVILLLTLLLSLSMYSTSPNESIFSLSLLFMSGSAILS